MSEKSQLQTSALFDYLSWRGDLSYEASPLCEVDSLILSILTYIDFTGFVSEELVGEKKPPVLLTVTKDFLRAQNGTIPSIGLIIPKETVTLLARAAKTPRFGLIRPFGYINRICDEEQKQFCAISFAIGQKDTFVAFRGTDDTLVGWKENFNMSFMHPVPAQREAVEYLERVAAVTEGKIYLGGHSKGGNLAVYAAVKSSEITRARIAAVYNNDGPGFDAEFIHGEDYKAIKDKIYTFVPQSSVVGMLLEHEESYTVVKSRLSGLLQHNGFSWEVMGGNFVRAKKLSKGVGDIVLLNDRIHALPIAARKHFVDVLFGMLESTGVKTLSELNARSLKHIITMIRTFNDMDQREQDLMLLLIAEMLDLRLMSDKPIDVNNDE
jgi:hypothetical protein